MARKKKPTAWTNRIVGSGERAAKEFVAHPDNYRIHPHAQEQALVGVLATVGWVQDVIVNKRTGYLVDGHLRVLAALREGDDTPVPYKEIDVSEHEEALLLASLDPLSALAGHDAAKYKELVDLLPADLRTLADLAWGDEDRSTETKVEFTARAHHRVVVDCADEGAAVQLHDRLVAEGYSCQLKA
jgi:hypothetical protein